MEFLTLPEIAAKYRTNAEMERFIRIDCDVYLGTGHTGYFLGDILSGRKKRK